MDIFHIGNQQILRLEEHECFSPSSEMSDKLKSDIETITPTENLPELQLMGMDYLFHEKQFLMNYYIGADWIDRKAGQVIEVLPKIRNIDYQRMLMKCFEHDEASEDLDELFFIRAEDNPIVLPSQDFQLEPLVIITFLNMVVTTLLD